METPQETTPLPVLPPYERIETFVIRFTNKSDFEAFFDKYFKGEGKPASIVCLSCQHGDAIKEKENTETLFCEFMEEFNLVDLRTKFNVDNEKKERIVERMEKFLEGCPY